MTAELSIPSLTPRLIVEKVDDAIEFYRATLHAELVERYALTNGVVVHAALRLGSRFSPWRSGSTTGGFFRRMQLAALRFCCVWKQNLRTPLPRAWSSAEHA
jgi:hypothetical protein